MRPSRAHIAPRTLTATALALLAAVALIGVGVAGAKKLTANPANHPELLSQKIDRSRYDSASHCVKRVPKGSKQLARFMGRYSRRSAAVGFIRCESLGSGLSVHSEGRAVDFGLDARTKSDKRAAMRMIRTWLQRDDEGRRAALARRMGVQMIIYNCKIWQAGEKKMSTYGYCSGGRRGVNPTAAHIDHMHVELTRKAAKLNTSYWRYVRGGGEPEQVQPDPPDQGGISPRAHSSRDREPGSGGWEREAATIERWAQQR
ncbi:MAG: hypothetical protein ACR2K6_04385 [Solirubrobacterales bacterium]